MSLSNVAGHRRPVQVLLAAIQAGRIAGAYLFVGPSGVGKSFTARQFAKALNCDRQTGDSCDACAQCRRVDRDEHPDLMVPARKDRRIVKGGAAGDRGKGFLREIVDRLHFPPVMGRKKVVLIDPADGLTDEAAGMLLKTLEEPPPDSAFILLSSTEHTVMPTLVSRCQRLRFAPLATEDLVAVLTRRGIDESLARQVAPTSWGSAEIGFQLAGQSDTENRALLLDYLLSLSSASLPQRVENALGILGAGASERQVARQLGNLSFLLARDVLHASCGMPDSDLVLADWIPQIRKLARILGKDGALGLGELVSEFSAGLQRNENPKHLLYFLGNELSRLSRSVAQPH